MKYMVVSYIDGMDNRNYFKVYKRAIDFIRREAKKWCKENEININEETDYSDGDDYFYGLVYEVCAYIKLYEIPQFNSKTEELLWNAKVEMDLADMATNYYKVTLTDCNTDYYISAAQKYIDEAMELLNEEV